MRGPHGELPVRIKGDVQSGFNAEFTPATVGAHTINVEYNGYAVQVSPEHACMHHLRSKSRSMKTTHAHTRARIRKNVALQHHDIILIACLTHESRVWCVDFCATNNLNDWFFEFW